jgi:hypothetical protein
MITVLLFILAAIGLRTGLHHAGYDIGPFEFWPVHLLFIVLLAYLAGYRELRADRDSGFSDMIRTGLRDGILYAIAIAVFAWYFYAFIDTAEFPERNALLVDGFISQGFREEEARRKVTGFYTPANYAGISFLALVVCAAVNVLAFSAIHHKLLRRFMR